MEIIKSIVLGIIQGITEWLPISSTGHLILFNQFLELGGGQLFWDLFEVVIQLGSILAVVILYFGKLNPFSPKKSAEEKKDTWTTWFKVAVGSIPVAILGKILKDLVPKEWETVVIATALIVYGILFIVIENRNKAPKTNSIKEMSFLKSLGIGLFQALSVIPGTSRSGSTIIGGIILGTKREVATEYSFFLAIPAMLGASLIKVLDSLEANLVLGTTEILTLAVGTLVSFAVSVVVIKLLMGYIKKHDFKVFGWYRIVLGAIVLLVNVL